MSATTISPFFRLSRELRDQIYHYTLLNQRATFIVANISLDVDYFEGSYCEAADTNRKLRWLLASRQLLTEGLDQFYKHACLKSHYTKMDSECQSLSLDGVTSIFDLKRVKSAHLSIRMGSERFEHEGMSWERIIPRGRELCDILDDNLSQLGSIIEKMDHCAFEYVFDLGHDGWMDP